jgi:hypothetical protein
LICSSASAADVKGLKAMSFTALPKRAKSLQGRGVGQRVGRPVLLPRKREGLHVSSSARGGWRWLAASATRGAALEPSLCQQRAQEACQHQVSPHHPQPHLTDCCTASPVVPMASCSFTSNRAKPDADS